MTSSWSANDLLPSGLPWTQMSSAVISQLSAQSPRRCAQLFERVLQQMPQVQAVFTEEEVTKMSVVFARDTAQSVQCMVLLWENIATKTFYHCISVDLLQPALQSIGFPESHSAALCESLQMCHESLKRRLEEASAGGNVLRRIDWMTAVERHNQHERALNTPTCTVALSTVKGSSTVSSKLEGGVEQYMMLHDALEQAQQTLDRCMR